MSRTGLGQMVRRGAAVCLAAAALGTLGQARTWVPDPQEARGLVTAPLRAELGDPEEAAVPLSVRLSAGQSPLFSANLAALARSVPSPTPRPTPLPTASPQALPGAQPAPDRDDVIIQPPQASSGERVVEEQTLVPIDSQGYVTGAGLYLYNRTGHDVDLADSLTRELSFRLEPAEAGPQILIIHTHATEAYTPDGENTYIPTDDSRTVDQTQNMLRVGDEMAQVFTSMGLNVLHDRGMYDYPQYNGAYGRSAEKIREYLEEYPTIRIVLDVHRDALEDEAGTVFKAVTTVDEVKTAQVMLVVGSQTDSSSHPNWRENLALAVRVQKNLDTLYPTLARPIILREAVYNQDLCPGSMLVEVGTHGSTLREALAGARDFARCAGAVFLSLAEN